MRVVCIVVLLGVLSHQYDLTSARSPSHTVAESERIYKAHLCKELLQLQQQLPDKFQQRFNDVQSVCEGSASNSDDILEYMGTNFTEDENTEIYLYELGRDKLCELTLNQPTVERVSDGAVEKVQNMPEFVALQNLCNDATVDMNELVELVVNLDKTFM